MRLPVTDGTRAAVQVSGVAAVVPAVIAPGRMAGTEPAAPISTHWPDVGQTIWVSEETALPDTVGRVSL